MEKSVQYPRLGHVNDIGADVVEEILRVRDQHQNVFVSFEFLLEPDAGVQIQVIRRLIQQHQVRLEEERSSERNAHSPTTREIGELFLLHLRGEAKTGQDARCFGFCFVDIEFVETVVNLKI